LAHSAAPLQVFRLKPTLPPDNSGSGVVSVPAMHDITGLGKNPPANSFASVASKTEFASPVLPVLGADGTDQIH
jgi:hypothetical protein